MQFSIRTGFGESDVIHGGSAEGRYHGFCQENFASPAGWSAISAVTVSRQRKKGHAINIAAPISGDSTAYCAVLFVDDTDIPQLGGVLDTVGNVTAKLQEAVNTWADGLRATGGALKHLKC